MDGDRFDNVVRSLREGSSRRTVLGLLLGGVAGTIGHLSGDARSKKKKKKGCRSCGVCQSCQNGQCAPKSNGVACGPCQTCRGGRCASSCSGGQICQGGTCGCAAGLQNCQGTCIPTDQCCAGVCPQNLTCCQNVNACKDVRNDAAFCGQCANGQCPGGAFCANGKCGLDCSAGQTCPGGCTCGTRVDPAHNGEKVCAEIDPFTCMTVPACGTDADCAPGTLGFRQVCVSGLCPPFNVCADPCA